MRTSSGRKGGLTLPLFFLFTLFIVGCSPDAIIINSEGTGNNAQHAHDILIGNPQEHQQINLTEGDGHLVFNYAQ